MAKVIAGVRYIAATDIIGLKELKTRYGVSTTTAQNWTKRDPAFPERVGTVSGKPVWDLSEVKAWRPLPGE